MVNEQIVNWIRENKSRGHGLAELRNNLLQSGYAKNEVDEAINAVDISSASKDISSASARKNKESEEKMKKKNGKKILKVIGAAAVLFIALLLWLFWPRQFTI